MRKWSKKPHSSQALNQQLQQTVSASLRGKLGGVEQTLIITSHFVCHHNAKAWYKEEKKTKYNKSKEKEEEKETETRLCMVHLKLYGNQN